MKETKPKRSKRWLAPLCILIAALLVLGGFFAAGVLRVNTPSRETYPVRGVDVSEYQGDIDWDTLAGQGIDFAFIKATEGSACTDPMFATNWQDAQNTKLILGEYHFFSFDSPGDTQAENFLKALPRGAIMLPSVVDVELYGAYKRNPPNAEAVQRELDTLLDTLEAETGQKSILYTTGRTRRLLLAEGYEEYPLWLRDVYFIPAGDDWTFWQYSDKGQLEGYAGQERYIDLNVYAGSRDELKAMTFVWEG